MSTTPESLHDALDALSPESRPTASVYSAMRETKYASIPMSSMRADMQRLASEAANTYMIYALVGHASPSPWSALEAQMKVITGEYEELLSAVGERDVKELRDGVADLLFTVIGMAYRAGIPINSDFEEVVRSNLTKFDTHTGEAEKTKAKYMALGIQTYCQPVEFTSGERGTVTYYITFVDGDQTGNDGKFYPNHKWLKSTRFVDIHLAPLGETHPLVLTSYAQRRDNVTAAFSLLEAQSDSTLYHTLLSTLVGLEALCGMDGTDGSLLLPNDEAFELARANLRLFFAYLGGIELETLDAFFDSHLPLSDIDRRYLNMTLTRIVALRGDQARARFLSLMESELAMDCSEFLPHLRRCQHAIEDSAQTREDLAELLKGAYSGEAGMAMVQFLTGASL